MAASISKLSRQPSEPTLLSPLRMAGPQSTSVCMTKSIQYVFIHWFAAAEFSDSPVQASKTLWQRMHSKLPYTLRHLDWRELMRDVIITNMIIPATTFAAYASQDVYDMRLFFLMGRCEASRIT